MPPHYTGHMVHTVDLGPPVIGMHSPYELASVSDVCPTIYFHTLIESFSLQQRRAECSYNSSFGSQITNNVLQ